MKSAESKSETGKTPAKDAGKRKTMDELRKPSTSIPLSEEDEFRIVSPGLHEPEGQTTHE